MVEMVEQVEIFERVVDDDFECERVEMVERGRVVDEMVEIDSIDDNDETWQEDQDLTVVDEPVENEWSDDETLDDEFDDVIITHCEIDETQSRTFIDYIWTQEIFGIIWWPQNDETVEMVEYIIEVELRDDTHQVDEMVEMVRIDEKSWWVMTQCTNNELLTFHDEKVEPVRKCDFQVNLIGDTNNRIERIEQRDGLFSKIWIIHTLKISHWRMMKTTNQFWFHGKIQHSNQVRRYNGKTQWFVFQQLITPQQ